ncbi:hypothetical protein ISS39_05880 [Candidatus Bathyarchaeota archaeon]|nr:hypothetical protein [Candidatus Bathyarchaeota archaeon]
MYCSRCWVENSGRADYCKGCGSALRSSDDWGRGDRFGPFDDGSPLFGILFALFVCAIIFSGFTRVIGFPWGFPWVFPWIPGIMLTPFLIFGLIFLVIFLSRR